MDFVFQFHTFIAQQIRLRCPTRRQPPCDINHAVAGVIAVVRRMAQHATEQTGVFVPTDQAGDLAVGGDFAKGDFGCGRKNFVG